MAAVMMVIFKVRGRQNLKKIDKIFKNDFWTWNQFLITSIWDSKPDGEGKYYDVDNKWV